MEWCEVKIKTVKKLNLPELIQYVWENEVYPSRFVPKEFGTMRYVEFYNGGMFRTGHGLHESDTFTVAVEEELTEETELDGLVAITNHDNIRLIDNIHTIESALSFEKTYEEFERIYSKSNGELKIVWTKEHGIPESGVLEEDVE